ncbi:SLC13 family permease [Deltaproteobacteria bacterium Smac51]|nr:SLC13 family permease [Deltaproteobacteria bacterium Smac51]
MIITIAILTVTVIFFTLGKFRSDMVALCALLGMILFGVLTPQEALAGFSNTIILTIAGVFVIGGAIVRSGLANTVSDRILKTAGSNQSVLFMLLMLITALIGSMVSNTGTVAIMMPIVASLSMSLNTSPSRFLMPLAFMSSIGGMLTLIGNPGNMVVNDVYVKAGYESLTLFSFLPVGIVSLIFGMLVLAPATSYYLSRRKNEKGEPRDKGLTLTDLAEKYNLAGNMYRVSVPGSSTLAGRSLMDLNLTGGYGVFIQEIRREKKHSGGFGPHETLQIAPGPSVVISGGDTIYVMGSQEKVEALAADYGLRQIKLKAGDDIRDKYTFDAIGICELVLMSSSRLVNITVAESGLREQFGLSVLSIQRGNQYIMENIRDQVMQSGDALLVQGTWDNITRLDESSPHWVVVGRPWDQAGSAGSKKKIPYVATVILLMIASMATGLLPTVVSVLLAALAMGVGGCFKNVEDAYSSINWETLVMIACMLPMATAMEKTGLVRIASDYMTSFGLSNGPLAALAMVYALTSVLNIIISATPVALLVAPVAIKVAIDLGVSPLPFVFAVATSSCMCFASPFSTPSNALVMSAGRYTFFDYLKIGLPLQALMGVVMVLALPKLFPF